MAKSSPARGILSRYVASTPSLFQVVNVLVKNHVSEIKILSLISFVIIPSILVTADRMIRAQSKRLRKTDAE
jgi:hypothetical protein